MHKNIIGLSVLIGIVSVGFNTAYPSANTHTIETNKNSNVRVINNGIVSPTTDDVKSKQNDNKKTATSTVSFKVIKPKITSSIAATNSLVKHLNDPTDYSREIKRLNNVEYNDKGASFYPISISNSKDSYVNGHYQVYQDGHITKSN